MAKKASSNHFTARCPNIINFVFEDGWVEIRWDEGSDAFVRALNEGSLVGEGKSKYNTLEEALQDLDQGIAS